jgi:hypothetical protein
MGKEVCFSAGGSARGCPRIELFSQIEAFFENKAYPKGTSYGAQHTLSILSIIFKK